MQESEFNSLNNEKLHFDYVFDEWAETYDQMVLQAPEEYNEVFENYEKILNRVGEKLQQTNGSLVLDIGSGTGNLANSISKFGYKVIGVEPNDAMRAIAQHKYQNIDFINGNFLQIPYNADNKPSGIVSSYAFHHLTDTEKLEAAQIMYHALAPKGVVIIADTMFETLQDRSSIIEDADKKGYVKLIDDLNREFYTSHQVLRYAFESVGFTVEFEKMNKFVWLLFAKK